MSVKEEITTPAEMLPLTDEVRNAVYKALKNESRQKGALAALLEGYHPADLADFLEGMPRAKRNLITDELSSDVLGDILVELEDGAQEHLLASMDAEVVKDVLADLESDDAVEIARQLEESDETDEDHDDAKKLLADKAHKRLFEYDADTAGGMMQLEVLTALPEQKISDVFKYLRSSPEDLPERPGTVFIINEKRKLLGTVSLSRMAQYSPSKKLSEVMRSEPINVLPDVEVSEVIRTFEKYDLHNLPVVNKRGSLLGRITIDDVLDAVLESHERQTARAAGIEEGEDIFAPVWDTTSKRLPWLIVNLFTAVLASIVIAFFQDDIEKLVALAVLMPIVASMGGNAGTQTMTVAVRGLATGKLTWKNAWYLLRKEISIGGLNGIFLGLLLAMGTFLFYQNAALAAVIAIATVANHLFAALAGHLIPIILKKFKYDPAISSGVLVTTVTDVGGFFVFLGLAALVLL